MTSSIESGKSPCASLWPAIAASAYLKDDSRVVRTPKEGSDSFDVVTRATDNGSFLHVEGETISWWAWQEERIEACPLNACDGNSWTVVSGLTNLQLLVADDEYVYFTERVDDTHATETPFWGLRLSRCPLTGCETPEVLVEPSEGLTGNVLLDGDFVYFTGTWCADPALADKLFPSCDYIGAVSK